MPLKMAPEALWAHFCHEFRLSLNEQTDALKEMVKRGDRLGAVEMLARSRGPALEAKVSERDGPGREPTSLAGGTAADHRRALVIAKRIEEHAARDPGVLNIREMALGTTTPLTPAEAWDLLRSPTAAQPRTTQHQEPDAVWEQVVCPDETGRNSFIVRAHPESPLGVAWFWSQSVSMLYACSRPAALWLLLVGKMCDFLPLQKMCDFLPLKAMVNEIAIGDGRSLPVKITLEVLPGVRPESVAALYKKADRLARGQRRGPSAAHHGALVAFVEAETKANGGTQPPLEVLRKRWNATAKPGERYASERSFANAKRKELKREAKP